MPSALRHRSSPEPIISTGLAELKNVGFPASPVTAISRPLSKLEHHALYNFEVHALECSKCRDLHRTSSRRTHERRPCTVGRPLAEMVSAFVMSMDKHFIDPNTRSVKHVHVELPHNYTQVRSLLKADERRSRLIESAIHYDAGLAGPTRQPKQPVVVTETALPSAKTGYRKARHSSTSSSDSYSNEKRFAVYDEFSDDTSSDSDSDVGYQQRSLRRRLAAYESRQLNQKGPEIVDWPAEEAKPSRPALPVKIYSAPEVGKKVKSSKRWSSMLCDEAGRPVIEIHSASRERGRRTSKRNRQSSAPPSSSPSVSTASAESLSSSSSDSLKSKTMSLRDYADKAQAARDVASRRDKVSREYTTELRQPKYRR